MKLNREALLPVGIAACGGVQIGLAAHHTGAEMWAKLAVGFLLVMLGWLQASRRIKPEPEGGPYPRADTHRALQQTRDGR